MEKCLNCNWDLKLIKNEWIQVEDDKFKNHKNIYKCPNLLCKINKIIIEREI